MDHNKAIALTSDKIKNYLKNLRSEQLASDVLNQTLDLAKEFRSKDYPLIHLLLQNPLAELISAAVPSPSSCTLPPPPWFWCSPRGALLTLRLLVSPSGGEPVGGDRARLPVPL
jgi:hypothetical protein